MIHCETIIIGAGAAGLMAAVGCPGSLVLEKMPRPGRKIMITGKGRCNLTNVKPWQEFSMHVHPKANALRPAFFNLTPEKLLDMFAAAGLPCVVERGQRAFPESHRAVDVVDTLVGMVRAAGSRIACECAVTLVRRGADNFVLETSKGVDYSCRKLIVTCGGLSYPSTGSDGDGHRFAAGLGHKVTRLYPSLTALTPVGSWEKQFMGRSMKNVYADLHIDRQLVQSEFGDIDFTDGGIEGPIGFKLSRRAVVALDNGGRVSVTIRFPDGSKPLVFDIGSYVGWRRAVVTNGGVSLDGIISKTMASRTVDGLYFAGEVLDLDCDTGGYNLHAAFATGYLAGKSCAGD